MTADAEAVLRCWFGELGADGLADREHAGRWWRKDPAFDAELRQRFAPLVAVAAGGGLEHWADTPRGRLALVILLDQLPRNLFRGDARAFAADGRAVSVALAGIAAGDDRALAVDERVFLYMPLMHSEDQAMQERAVALFAALRDELDGAARERAAGNLDFAVRHRDIVARFGRFPHRNAVLGRQSTAAEVEFLRQPGSSF